MKSGEKNVLWLLWLLRPWPFHHFPSCFWSSRGENWQLRWRARHGRLHGKGRSTPAAGLQRHRSSPFPVDVSVIWSEMDGTKELIIIYNHFTLSSEKKKLMFMFGVRSQMFMCAVRRPRVDRAAGRWTTGQRNGEPQGEVEHVCTSLRPRSEPVASRPWRPHRLPPFLWWFP